MKNEENTMALIRKVQMDRIEINEHELESVTGGVYDTITDEMKEVTGGDENEWIDGYWQNGKDYFQKIKPAIH